MHYHWVRRPSARIIKEIAGLYCAAGWWASGDSPARISRMVRGSHCFLLAYANDKAIGMGRAVSDRANDAYLQDVFVLPKYQGQGVGAALVECLKLRLLADDLKWIGLIATGRSSSLYKRLGFSPMARHTPMLLRRP